MHISRWSLRETAGPITALAMALPLSAQTPLGPPQATFPEDFGAIQTVRELPDGRVLVADPLGKLLYAVDVDAGSRTAVGSQGQGPGEYVQPDAVWPLPGDSTLLVDLGNGRLVALGSDLGFGPTMPIGLGEPRPGAPLVLALPQGVDGRGRIYARAMGGPGGALADSADILRIDRVTRRQEAVGRFKLPGRTQQTAGGAGERNVRIAPLPLTPEDAWGVAPDGSVAIARAGDYHVEWIAPDGRVVRGPAQGVERIGVGTAEKEAWVTEQGRGGGGLQIGVTMMNGQMSMSFGRGGQGGGPREIDGYTWPDRLPAFHGGRLPIDPQSRAWVRRHGRAGAPTTYDVFDRRGERVGSVTLPGDRRVVGFGRGTVYVVAFDDFDLSWLERYGMPGL